MAVRGASAVSVCFALLVVLAPRAASAQTVGDVAGRFGCSTAGVEGLSAQLVQTQLCMRPDLFVRAAPHEGVVITSSRVHPLMSRREREALWRAAERASVQVTSMFRTLVQQYVLYHSGACGAVAPPGASNHQSGRAVDLSNWSSVRSTMEGAGCHCSARSIRCTSTAPATTTAPTQTARSNICGT